MQYLHTITEFELDHFHKYEDHHPRYINIANYNNTLVVYWDLDYKNSFIHTYDLATGSLKKHSHLYEHEFGLGKNGREIVVSYQDGISAIDTDTLKYCPCHGKQILFPTYQAFCIGLKSPLIATAYSHGNFTGEIEIKDYESNHYYVRSTFDGLTLCNHQSYQPSKKYTLNLSEIDFLNISPLIFTPDDKILIAHFIRLYLGKVNFKQERYRSVLQLWNVKEGDLIQTIDELPKLTITSVGVRPNGTIIACGIREEKVCAWELQSDRIIYTASEMSPCILSTDGRVLIYATAKHEIVIRDLVADRELITLQGHQAAIAYLALSEDWQFIASYSIDRQIKIWGIPDRS